MDFQRAYRQLSRRLVPGATLHSWQPLHGGVSAHVVLLRLNRPGGSQEAPMEVVLRMPGEAAFKEHGADCARREFDLLTALHRAGLPVPQPLLFEAEMLERPCYVMERVAGSTELAETDVARAMDQMADFLNRLHSLDPSELGLEELVPPLEDPAEGALQYLADDELGRAARAKIEALDRAPLNSPPSRLVHGDYWPGNVLWQQGRLVAVIDWEDAALGDPLADLAAARGELLCQHGRDAMQRFTERYLDRSGPLDAQRLLLWEIYVSCSALATMAQWGLEPADEAHRRRETTAFLARAVDELRR